MRQKADFDAGSGRDGGGLAVVECVAHERGFWNPEWKLEKFNRVGLRCGRCGHAIEESGPFEGRQLLAMPELLVVIDAPLFSPKGEQVGGGQMHAQCPKCHRGTMDAYSPDYEAGAAPDDVVVVKGNVLLNEGIQELWDLGIAVGGSEVSFANATAQVGAGSSNTAEAASQTDLQGVSTAWAGMEGGYPSRSSQTVSWQGSFGSAVGNFAWEEVSVRNDATRDRNLNRKVTSLGTKSSGTTWVLTIAITIT